VWLSTHLLQGVWPHTAIAEASGAIAQPRRVPSTTPEERTADEVHPRLPEVDVDDAVQHEIKREVASDQNVYGHGDSVRNG